MVNGEWLIANDQPLFTAHCLLLTAHLSPGPPTMPQLRPGQPAPDVTLSTLGDRTVPLATYWGDGHYLWLIFLRHLA